MSDEKVWTKEIVEQFWADDDSAELTEFTAREAAAAESLSKHKESLNLRAGGAAETFSSVFRDRTILAREGGVVYLSHVVP